MVRQNMVPGYSYETHLDPAWRVDFNVSLPSFEPLIAGARKLLDLALESSVAGGPRVLFVSSISAILSMCLFP